MKKAAKEFAKTVMADPGMQARIKAQLQPQNEAERDEFIKMHILPLAKELGYTLTLEDFTCDDNGEMDDAELEAVAGGMCYCLFYGSGSGRTADSTPYDYDNYNCSCILYGTGFGERSNATDYYACITHGNGTDDGN